MISYEREGREFKRNLRTDAPRTETLSGVKAGRKPEHGHNGHRRAGVLARLGPLDQDNVSTQGDFSARRLCRALSCLHFHVALGVHDLEFITT